MPVFGLGIRPRGPSTFPSRPAELHHVRRGDHRFVIRPAFLNFLDHVVAADEIRAGFLRLANFFAAGDHQHALRFAEPVRQHHRAAHHLVRVLGIDAQIQHQLHGLVELHEVRLLERSAASSRLYGRASTSLRALIDVLSTDLSLRPIVS